VANKIAARAKSFSNKEEKMIDFLIKKFEVDIKKNDIEYSASLLFVGSTLSSFLFQVFERDLGLILILASTIILFYVLLERKHIKEKYSKQVESILNGSLTF